MAIFDPLRQAISDVLTDADDTGCDGLYTVSSEYIDELQAQYDEFFVDENLFDID